MTRKAGHTRDRTRLSQERRSWRNWNRRSEQVLNIVITSGDSKWIVQDVIRIQGFESGVQGTTMVVEARNPKNTRFLRQPFTIERAEE